MELQTRQRQALAEERKSACSMRDRLKRVCVRRKYKKILMLTGLRKRRLERDVVGLRIQLIFSLIVWSELMQLRVGAKVSFMAAQEANNSIVRWKVEAEGCRLSGTWEPLQWPFHSILVR